MTAWDIESAVYINKFFYLGNQDSTPCSISFSPDGTLIYVLGYNTKYIFQYNLSIAWDISTAVYSGKSLYVFNQDSRPHCSTISSNGTTVYLIGEYTDTVFQYNLSIAWDISTAVDSGKSLDIGGQEGFANGIFFSPNGENMYIVGSNNNRVYQYTLRTAWDLKTARYSGDSFYVGPQDYASFDLFFDPGGTKMYVIGLNTITAYQYSLSVAWDISTASYIDKFLYLGDQAVLPYGIAFKLDGEKMYILDLYTKKVYKYSLVGPPPPPPKNEASRTGVYSFKTSKV